MRGTSFNLQRLVFGFSLCCFVSVQSLAQSPHEEGLAAGQTANAATSPYLNPSSAGTVVPAYSNAPPETRYFQQSNLSQQAQTRLSACQAANDPVCEAQVGAMNSAHTPRETVSPYDPSVLATHRIANLPGSQLEDIASFYGGCQVSNCPSNVYCVFGNCYNTSAPADIDFARAMTYMEAAREAGTYLDTDRMEVFKGEVNRCRDHLLKNCCASNAAGNGMSNRGVFGVGSRLVFDVLMNATNRDFLLKGFSALLSGAGFSGAFSSYGVTVAVNGATLPTGSAVLYSGQSMVVAIDPWSLAISVTLYVAMSMMSCNVDEGKLTLKEGAGLCHTVGDYCSECIGILGRCITCVENTTSKCCFNSQLSRLIHEQGRQQFGKAWGSPQSPDCSGFTVAQLQRLDFSNMDLSAFYASIVPNLPNVAGMQNANVHRASTCYYRKGSCP